MTKDDPQPLNWRVRSKLKNNHMIHKHSQFDSSQIMYRAEELVNAASNRYRITVQVANRAKRRRYEDIDTVDDPTLKPIARAIVEMADELTQPEIIGD
jgi:DNA-directed RNA polymerase subunit omega